MAEARAKDPARAPLRVLVLSGPNLQLLGTREPEIYGAETLPEIHRRLVARGKELGVRVYSIAVGSSDRGAPDGRLSVDTSQIRKMAERCDGAFFEAPDAAALSRVYEAIDKLEKVVIEEPQYRIEERFLRFLGVALALLLGSRLVRSALGELAP